MRIRTLLGASALAALAASAALFAPASPAGACSLVEPCWDARGEVLLGQPIIEPVEVAEDASPPEWLDSEATLEFAGTGWATELTLDTVTYTF